MKIALRTFRGIAPKFSPRILPDDAAQVARNVEAFGATLAPLASAGATITTLTNSGALRSIYRFGQDLDVADNYWFAWDHDVDVCPTQVAGDTAEWTFWTDYDPDYNNGAAAYPKATNNALALAGAARPSNWRRLGLPTPVGAVLGAVSDLGPTQYPAKITFSGDQIENLSSTSVFKLSADGGNDFTRIELSDVTPAGLAAAIEDQSTAKATAFDDYVEIESPLAGPDAGLRLVYGELLSTTLSARASGVAEDAPASVEVDVANIYSIKARLTDRNNWVRVYSASYTTVDGQRVYDFQANTDIVDAINASSFAANITARVPDPDNGHIIIETDVAGAETELFVSVEFATGLWPYGTKTKEYTGRGLDASTDTTELVLSGVNLSAITSEYDLEVSLDNLTWTKVQVANNSPDVVAAAINGAGLAITATSANGSVTLTRNTAGPLLIAVRYSVESVTTLQAAGREEDLGIAEARAYTYTWVSTSDGLTMESGPAPASELIDVYDGQTVTLSGFDAVPAGSNIVVTGKRIYRSVAGTYLFVAEIGAAATSFVDDVTAEGLGEEMPSITWEAPPDKLRGLINLPGGVMAGFVGRDVYFCEPYKPYAWPSSYVQTVDAPIVGLGRMDTTLAVLTKGNPYFMQGASPELMTVVKSDIEQACVSKRSIVSVGGGVVYASPDGLVFLSPGGSRVITQGLFGATEWRALLVPESIHAYAHDGKYIAFFATTVAAGGGGDLPLPGGEEGGDAPGGDILGSPGDSGGYGGLVLDVLSGQITLHDAYYHAGYTDLRADRLFLITDTKQIVPWAEGSPMTGTWRSKLFSLPQPMTFSCAQVEAENYPLTARFYRDSVLIHTKTVESRDMFRLPPGYGRDWEVELETPYEVFNVAIAQAPSELASV